jgi:hypothetical protein
MDRLRKILNEELTKIYQEDWSKVKKGKPFAVLNDYKFTDEHTGYFDGQHNHTAIMYDKETNKPLVKVDYVDYKDEITISLIEALEGGKGYGKILMIYLAKKYGYENLERTSLTQSGAKMRQELDKLFGFNYSEYKKSQSKHIDKSKLDEIKDPIIKGFLIDLVNMGYEPTWTKWLDTLRDNGYYEKYDFNVLGDVAEWIKGSQTNTNNPNDEPPEWVNQLLMKI